MSIVFKGVPPVFLRRDCVFISILKDLRAKSGFSQAQLAKEVGVSPGNISDWEAGKSKPGYSALAGLVRVFGVSADYLLGLTPVIKGIEKADNDDDLPRFEVYCDGVPLTESEADLVAMYRLLPEEHRKESFEFIHFKYSRFVVGGEKASIYSTYSDTKEQQKSAPDHGDKTKGGIA